MIIAAGPYTLKDNLSYQPLQDLIKHIMEKKPDVVIFVGPFMDVMHEKVADGSLEETFDSFFENLVEAIMTPMEMYVSNELRIIA